MNTSQWNSLPFGAQEGPQNLNPALCEQWPGLGCTRLGARSPGILGRGQLPIVPESLLTHVAMFSVPESNHSPTSNTPRRVLPLCQGNGYRQGRGWEDEGQATLGRGVSAGVLEKQTVGLRTMAYGQ